MENYWVQVTFGLFPFFFYAVCAWSIYEIKSWWKYTTRKLNPAILGQCVEFLATFLKGTFCVVYFSIVMADKVEESRVSRWFYFW